MKNYLDKNVLEAAYERLEYVFNNFDNVYFSVSGGKDSSVMIQLADQIALKLNKQYDILYIDLEAQYKNTIKHMEDLQLNLKCVNDFYWVSLPLQLRNAVSQLQPKWICWSPTQEKIWVRKLPIGSINISNNPFDFFKIGMEFEEFIIEFAKWYKEKKGGLVGAGIGIRSDESLNRWRTITSTKKETYKDLHWTTLLKENQKKITDVYNFYPIYDWKTQDIWAAVSKLDLLYNEVYEMMYKNGVSIHEQRLCQPYGDDQKNGLDQYKSLEYETWEKILNRVNGVNFGNIYARTSALGNIKSCKPNNMNWQQYAIFLLESIGLYNKELEIHYREKIIKFLSYWEKHYNCTIEMVTDEADSKLESSKKVPSWKRVARALERNDFYMKRLSFSQTKSDNDKLHNMIKKYDNLLSVENTNDKHLKEQMEVIENGL
jgi:predicted phosphoadenosine phosphosulfate sulfurtransferase